MKSISMKTVAVIGGGPAGLMATDVLSRNSIHVDLFEAKPSFGRKFLVAGKGGLNVTHPEPFEAFVARFGSQADTLRPILSKFGADEVKRWCLELGIESFVGPSGRVFPSDMKALPLLNKWLGRLRGQGVDFKPRHQWLGWSDDGALNFQTDVEIRQYRPDATILCLGGASWPKLGSNGSWVPLLTEHGLDVAPLRPSNCGFDIGWSDHFRDRFSGAPLKSVVLKVATSTDTDFQRKGSCVVTSTGMEGSLVYAASALIRDEIELQGCATIEFDLAPDRSVESLVKRLSAPRGSRSLSNHLRRTIKLHGVELGLLREFATDKLQDSTALATAIKSLPIPVNAARPIEEAISTAGGVRFESLNENLMSFNRPGVWCAGEMLDWEAPTGGYLLTACLATGRRAAEGAMKWLGKDEVE